MFKRKLLVKRKSDEVGRCVCVPGRRGHLQAEVRGEGVVCLEN